AANIIAAKRADDGVDTVHGRLKTRARPAWEQGAVAIRPERIRVCQGKSEGNGLQVRVREVIYRGDHCDVFVEPGESRLWVRSSVALKADDRIWIELPVEHLEVLD